MSLDKPERQYSQRWRALYGAGYVASVAGALLAFFSIAMHANGGSDWFLLLILAGGAVAIGGLMLGERGARRAEGRTTDVTAKVSAALRQHTAPLAFTPGDVPEGDAPPATPPVSSADSASVATPSQDRMIEQINGIVTAELRKLERRGLRTQWFFFAAGVPVGILINMFVK